MQSTRRIGFWAVAVCFLAVTVAIRYELASPGVSALFETFAFPEAIMPLSVGSIYSLALALHHAAGLLIIGAIAIAAARIAQQSTLTTANWVKWAVWAIVGYSLLSIIGLMPRQIPQLWTLLGGSESAASNLGNTPGFVVVSEMNLQLLFCLTIMAAALMISRSKTEGKAANAVCFGTLLGLGFYVAATIADSGAIRMTIILAGGPLWLLAFCAFLQSDGDRAGNSYLMIGAGLSVVLLVSSNIDLTWHDGVFDSAWRTMLTHMGLIGFSIFAGFAVLDIRLQPRLPRLLIWAHGAALVLGVFGAFSPLGLLGQQGMPRGYVDYPETYADGNFGATIGSYALLALIVVGIFMMRRYRQPAADQADLQTQAESQQPPAYPDHPQASAPRPVP